MFVEEVGLGDAVISPGSEGVPAVMVLPGGGVLEAEMVGWLLVPGAVLAVEGVGRLLAPDDGAEGVGELLVPGGEGEGVGELLVPEAEGVVELLVPAVTVTGGVCELLVPDRVGLAAEGVGGVLVPESCAGAGVLLCPDIVEVSCSNL